MCIRDSPYSAGIYDYYVFKIKADHFSVLVMTSCFDKVGLIKICFISHTHKLAKSQAILKTPVQNSYTPVSYTHLDVYKRQVGMTGSYEGVIGVKRDIIIKHFLTQLPVRHELAKGKKQMCAVFCKISPAGKAEHIERILIKE